jgi:ribosomal peptide maturation radical SAM protein 1
LVVPPFANVAYPALGPSILTTACRKRGIHASVFYANLSFAASIGFRLYQTIALSSLRNMFGEAIFRPLAFDCQPKSLFREGIVEPIFSKEKHISISGEADHCLGKIEISFYLNEAETFIRNCVQTILNRQPKIVGFSSVFQQNLSSIALARQLKRLQPEILTVLGGGNASQPMGAAIATVTDAFDFIFSGEADFEFPRFCQAYLESGRLPQQKIFECEPIFELDHIEIPEYDDFFEQLTSYVKSGHLPESLPDVLLFETSRGCWFGTKSHCTFCGLNGLEISYRRKSAKRIFAEIDRLVDSYAIKQLQATDNIMPREFREEVLPILATRTDPLELFYEVKSNLTARDLDLFVLAGVVQIQAGIESFSSNVLKQMAKGVTGIQNIQLLRDCGSRQIQVYWNLLWGIPGEMALDYEAMFELFPLIEHLQPPYEYGCIRIDRFSPYHTNPDKYGIKNLRPFSVYADLYPRGVSLHELAYHFEGDYTTELLVDTQLQLRLAERLSRWTSIWKNHPPRLYSMPLANGFLLVEDSRSCAIDRYCVLTPDCSALLESLDKPIGCGRIQSEALFQLKMLQDRHFIIEYEDHYMNIVTAPRIGIKLREYK